MCRKLLFITFCLFKLQASAQVQYWGISPPTAPSPGNSFGYNGVFRVDSNAMNAELVLPFDTGQYIGSPTSGSELLLASDGLVYGLTARTIGTGTLFCVDPVTDSTRIVVQFGTAQYPNFGSPGYWSSLVEAQSGVIIGHTGPSSDPATVFRYNMANQSVTQLASLPFTLCGDGNQYPVTLQGTPFLATDGYLYAISPEHYCKGDQMARIDPASGAITRYFLPEGVGRSANGDHMLERNGKLYFTCYRGGPDDSFFGLVGRGTTVEFDLATAQMQQVADYTDDIHNPWNGWISLNDSTWLGEAAGSPWVGGGVGGATGCLYAYHPIDHTLEKLFDYGTAPLSEAITGVINLGGILKGSNSKVYGSFRYGLFEYDPMLDTLALRSPLQYNNGNGVVIGHGATGAMIEICRKPNYKPRSTTSFNVCAGAHFFYDLQNVNATNVVWRRNGTVVPAQTNQRLEFTAITEGDEGVWTCTLTNECGITEPPTITITVNAGAFTTSIVSGDTLLCGSGDTATLTGNNGGTWSAGGTSASLTVTVPGTYYLMNQQSCGLSMSNQLEVVYSDSAFAPGLTVDGVGVGADTLYVCAGSQILLGNNSAGAWGNLPSGLWQDGSDAETFAITTPGTYYVYASNACNSDTSAIYTAQYPPTPGTPELLLSNGAYLCTGGSTYLQAPADAMYILYQNGVFVTSIFPDFPALLDSAGTYELVASNFCNGSISDPLSFTIYLDSLPPSVNPIILPDLSFLQGCDQDTVYLSTTDLPVYWSWTNADLVQQYDTAQSVLLDWTAGNGGSYLLTAFNGCGEGSSDLIQVQGIPAPDVQWSITSDTVCLSDGAQALSAGTPAGGTYNGPGVTGNTFNPAVAGIGQHTITYSYSDGNCTGFAQAVLVVDVCTGVEQVHDAAGITVSPNPNDGAFQVYIERVFKVGTLMLFDARGKRVGSTTRLAPGSNAITQTDLAPGVYQLRLEIDGKVEQRRVVITRE